MLVGQSPNCIFGFFFLFPKKNPKIVKNVTGRKHVDITKKEKMGKEIS